MTAMERRSGGWWAVAQLQTFLITTLTRYGDSVAAARRHPHCCPLGDHRACREQAHTSISKIDKLFSAFFNTPLSTPYLTDECKNKVCEKGWHMSNTVVEVGALSQFRRTVEQWHRPELCVTITAREIISSRLRVVRIVSRITKIFFIGEHFTFLS